MLYPLLTGQDRLLSILVKAATILDVLLRLKSQDSKKADYTWQKICQTLLCPRPGPPRCQPKSKYE